MSRSQARSSFDQPARPSASSCPALPTLSSSMKTQLPMAAAAAGTSPWLRLAALSGASAVALGAYGAHAFKPANLHFLDTFDRGNKYHLVHSLLLAVAPHTRRPAIVGSLATAGILLFSGSCYAAALTEDKALGRLAPYGGMSLIAAWLALAL